MPDSQAQLQPQATAQVDVTLNIFAKPYQTALSVLSLLKYSARHIDRLYLQFEPAGSRYDAVPPYAVAEYLGERARVCQPEMWIECDAVDRARLSDPAYRLALRYQAAFEATDKKYLFIMHNDVLIKGDIIGAMLADIGGAFALGQVGQCWNCPAANAEVMAECGFAGPCGPERYQEFRPSFADLERIYAAARSRGLHIRPYWEGWLEHYGPQAGQLAWPLPECRVNEWGCLVDVEQTRPLTMPQGDILPFGAYEPCGSVTLDIAVPWFRDLHRRGLKARHFKLDRYLRHWVGSHRMTRELHRQAELEAQEILFKAFPDFVLWCRKRGNGMFT